MNYFIRQPLLLLLLLLPFVCCVFVLFAFRVPGYGFRPPSPESKSKPQQPTSATVHCALCAVRCAPLDTGCWLGWLLAAAGASCCW
jgi:hypothetical protein